MNSISLILFLIKERECFYYYFWSSINCDTVERTSKETNHRQINEGAAKQ